MKRNKIQKNSGFTIIETLVAIFILLLSITGPLAVAQSGLKAAFIARDQTIAFYLSQDAMEFVKNIRDSNFIKKQDWLLGLDNCVGIYGRDAGDKYCSIDTTTDAGEILSCGTDNIGCSLDSPLNQNQVNYSFGLGDSSNDVPTKFYRKVHITEIEDREANVQVVVGWITEEGVEKTVIARENIFKWAPIY